jgi:hypothetical protein
MFLKDPNARLDYEVDWSAMCGADRSIVSSSWLVSPQREGGVAVSGDSLDGNVARVWIDGGEDGDLVLVVNRAVFSDGAIDERSVTIRIGER